MESVIFIKCCLPHQLNSSPIIIIITIPIAYSVPKRLTVGQNAQYQESAALIHILCYMTHPLFHLL